MARKKNDPLLTAAQTAALAQFGPQLQAAAALEASRLAQHMDTNKQIQSAGQIISAGAQQAGYGLADLLHRAGAAQVHGPNNDEAALVAQNLGLTSQSALANLADTRSRAAQGVAYGLANERKSYLSDLGSIRGQEQQLQGQYGTSVADYYNKAVQQANDQAFKAQQGDLQRQTQLLSSGVDPKTGGISKAAQAKLDATNAADAKKQAAADKKTAAAAKWLAPKDQNTAINDIKSVAQLIKRELGTAAPPDTTDPSTGKKIPGGITLPDGTKIPPGAPLTSGAIRMLLTTPGNPLGKAYDHDTINAAFDLAQRNGLSGANVDALHKAGIKVHGRLPTLASMPQSQKIPPGLNGILGGSGKP